MCKCTLLWSRPTANGMHMAEPTFEDLQPQAFRDMDRRTRRREFARVLRDSIERIIEEIDDDDAVAFRLRAAEGCLLGIRGTLP